MENSIVAFATNLATSKPVAAYIFFFINSSLQILFPPYPGDTVLILEGYLSSLNKLNTSFMLASTLSGTYLSSIFLYFISYKYGNKILSNKFISKFFDINKINKLQKWFSKYGAFAIIINKFVPGIGSLTLIAAGIFKLQPVSALISIGIVTVIHNTFLFMGGKYTGNNIHKIKFIFSEYTSYIITGAIFIGIIFLYIRFLYKKKNKL